MLTVKLVPAVRAVTTGPIMVANDVLQVTLRRVPKDESGVISISLLAVTAEVFTTMDVVAAAMVNAPALADPHTAGEAEEAQFVAVAKVVPSILPSELITATPELAVNWRPAIFPVLPTEKTDAEPLAWKSIKFPAKPLGALMPNSVPEVLNVVGPLAPLLM